MTTVRLHQVLDDLRGRLGPDRQTDLSDDVLLERFLTRRDHHAFAGLVRRHGNMVYGVCRRVLQNGHDAEDAFQATFLVLARKGAALRRLRSLTNWLYGVAFRTAQEARRSAARRRRREANVTPREQAATADLDGLREALDEEMARLPDSLRAALVLCDLEGHTRRSAAEQLGWPEGTVASRLDRARKTMASRLRQRGLVVPSLSLTVASLGEATAGVPRALLQATVRVAMGQAMAGSGVATLLRGVLLNMMLQKLKLGLGVVLASVVFFGAGSAAYRGSAVDAADAAKPVSEVDALRHQIELLKLNLDVVLEKVRTQEAELKALKSAAKSAHAVDPLLKNDQVAIFTTSDVAFPIMVNSDNILSGLTVNVAPRNLAEQLIKALREAKDDVARKKAVDGLEELLKQLEPTKPAVKPDDVKSK